MRKRSLAIVLIGAATLAFAAMQDPLTLRLNLKDGFEDKYKVTMESATSAEVPGMGPMEMGMKGGYDYTIKTSDFNVEKNQANVALVTTNMKFEASGPMAGMMDSSMLPKEVKTSGKMDARYRLTETKMEGLSAEMMMMMSTTTLASPFIELPEAAVKIGDTWDVSVPKNPMMGIEKDVVLKATLKGEGELGTKSGLIIEMSGKLPLSLDLSKVLAEMAKSGNDPSGGAAAGMNMTMNGSIDMKYQIVLSKSTNRVEYAKIQMNQNLNVNLVDMGMSLPVSGPTTMTFTLAK